MTKRTRRARPDGLPARIAQVIDLYDSQKKAAALIGVTPETLQNWITGRQQPRFIPLTSLAVSKEVNLRWLTTGEGEMLGGAPPKVDRQQILAAFAELAPEERAALIKAAADIDVAKSIYGAVTKSLAP